LTIEKFRNIDIALLSFIAVIVDVIGILLFKKSFIVMYFSLSYVIVILTYVRWGRFGLIPNILVSINHLILYFTLSSDNATSIVLHGIAILSLYMFYVLKKYFIKETMTLRKLLTGYVLTYLMTLVVEYALFFIFNQAVDLWSMLLNHIFNFILVFGVLIVVYKQKNLCVDMHQYLVNKNER
jgi:hypothetical protein